MNIRRRQRGSMMIEFVIGIVFVGVVIGPLLLYAVRMQDLNNALGQQARAEAWRSFSDQALAAGIDPSLAPGLANTMNPAVPAVTPVSVTAGNVTAVAGLADVVPLQAVFNATIEGRAVGAGYQLGPGLTVAPRSVPAAPLVPIVMPTPIMTPGNGAVLATTDLTPGAPNQPYTLPVTATSMAGSTVTLALNQPNATVKGSGSAQSSVTAVNLLNLVNGIAWTEYTGNQTGGDQSMVLSDGRTRWFVTQSDGRVQIYEPSATASFAYHINLGTPVLVRGGVENASGATLNFDYGGYVAVQSGSTSLVIDFPLAEKAVFGNAWSGQSIGYAWTFQNIAGPFSGNLIQFFQADTQTDWADSVAVAAQPQVPSGAIVANGTWTLTRTKTTLGAPIESTSADSVGFWAPGNMRFTAPTAADGTQIGRLSVNNNVSTGTSLTVPVSP